MRVLILSSIILPGGVLGEEGAVHDLPEAKATEAIELGTAVEWTEPEPEPAPPTPSEPKPKKGGRA